jgi:hypothetical protein
MICSGFTPGGWAQEEKGIRHRKKNIDNLFNHTSGKIGLSNYSNILV